MNGFQTLGQGFGQENPLAQALMAIKQNKMGSEQTTQPPESTGGLLDQLSAIGDKMGMVGDYVDNSGLAGVAAQMMDTAVNKRGAEVADRGAQTQQEERLLRMKGYKASPPMGAQGGAMLVGDPGSGVRMV